jgi:hypothetical protein
MEVLMFRNWRWLLLVLLVGFGGMGCEHNHKIDDVANKLVHKIDPETIKLIFDRVEEIRAKIKKDIDELSEKNITRLEKFAQRLRENTKRDILEIEAQLNKDINILVDRIDEKYRSAARELISSLVQSRYHFHQCQRHLGNPSFQLFINETNRITNISQSTL